MALRPASGILSSTHMSVTVSQRQVFVSENAVARTLQHEQSQTTKRTSSFDWGMRAMRPNILYLHSHDTGRLLEPYGYPIPTPNLLRLAGEGVLFRKAFCESPTGSPSRAALLTGQSAHATGVLGAVHRGFALKNTNRHIIHTLRHHGYYSALAGIQNIAVNPETTGYDAILGGKRDAERAIGFLRDGPKQPFFLSVGFQLTGRTFPEPDPCDDFRYTAPLPNLPDTPETRNDMACLHASVRMLDQRMGAIINALDGSGVAKNTLVICTTDHGADFPQMKCDLSDFGTGVMLIMRGPGGFSGGWVCDAIVSQIDLFPTLCDLLKIDAPDWLEGRSMMPVINGDTDEVNEEIHGEVSFHAAYEPQRSVRTKRWKYIRQFDDRDRPVLVNCGDGPSKSLLMEHGWADQRTEYERLHDLILDPLEQSNLAGKLSKRIVLEEMRHRLERWMKRTNDPLLNGPLEPPDRTLLNEPSARSARQPARKR